MGKPVYLTMTAAEFSASEEKPAHLAWMACHFSPYGAGLSNIPKTLPSGSLLILNDRIEPTAHDANLVAAQMREVAQMLQCGGILLDFQRPGSALTQQIAAQIAQALPCPVAVSHHYAAQLNCAVFLPPPPLRRKVAEHFAPWEGREVWLEVYDQWETVTVTEDAALINTEVPAILPELSHYDEGLCCSYAVEALEDRAIFTLHRGIEELQTLPCCVTKFVGLWQEFRS